MTVSAQDRARKIKIILFDVDGVWTDGTIWLFPFPVVAADGSSTTRMVEVKGYSAHDGAGITLARLGGMKCGVITKRISETVAMRECGLAVAVANARERVKAEAHYVTPHRGGDGAARDAIEFILEAKGVLDKCIEASIDESNPLPPSMDIGKGGDLK